MQKSIRKQRKMKLKDEIKKLDDFIKYLEDFNLDSHEINQKFKTLNINK